MTTTIGQSLNIQSFDEMKIYDNSFSETRNLIRPRLQMNNRMTIKFYVEWKSNIAAASEHI